MGESTKSKEGIGKPNAKESIAMFISIVPPIATLVLTLVTDLKIELTADQKVMVILMGAIIGVIFLVSILFISEMQKRRKTEEDRNLILSRKNNYTWDEKFVAELVKDRPRFAKFVFELYNRTSEDEPLDDLRAELESFGLKLGVVVKKPKIKDK